MLASNFGSEPIESQLSCASHVFDTPSVAAAIVLLNEVPYAGAADSFWPEVKQSPFVSTCDKTLLAHCSTSLSSTIQQACCL